jgi:hypothetical protein
MVLAIALQWSPLNGIAVNGIAVNGIAVNGIAVNGIAVNGIAVNGINYSKVSKACLALVQSVNQSVCGLMVSFG